MKGYITNITLATIFAVLVLLAPAPFGKKHKVKSHPFVGLWTAHNCWFLQLHKDGYYECYIKDQQTGEFNLRYKGEWRVIDNGKYLEVKEYDVQMGKQNSFIWTVPFNYLSRGWIEY